MIYVLIPVHNRLKLTKNCVNSLLKQKNCEKIKIVIVDDGSTDGTSDYFKKNFPKIDILQGTGNLYWGGAINYGIDYIKKKSKINDWLLIVNNDTVLTSNSISNLIESSIINNKKVLVGALTVNLKDKKTVIKSGSIVKSWFFNKTEHVYDGLNINSIKNKKKLIKVDYLTGRCLLHPLNVFKHLGNYDSKNFRHYGADDDFTFRAKKFGYECLICSSSIVYLETEDNKKFKKKFLERFMFVLFDIKSSANIINKLLITYSMVPIYAKLSFFIIGVIKSLYIFLMTYKKIK